MPSRNTASVVNATLSKNARRVLAAIARSGGACHCGTLAQELRLSASTVGVHANDLYRAGLVEVRCVGPQVSEHAIEDTISQIGNGFVAWSHRGVPTRTWSREGETDRTPSPNSYSLSVTVDGLRATA